MFLPNFLMWNLLLTLIFRLYADDFKYLYKEREWRLSNEPVRQRLAVGPSECWEDTPSMEPAVETVKKEGGGTTIVSNVLLGGGPGSITLWGIYLVLLRGNVLEYGGSAHGIPTADNRSEGKAAEGQDLAKQGIIEGS